MSAMILNLNNKLHKIFNPKKYNLKFYLKNTIIIHRKLFLKINI